MPIDNNIPPTGVFNITISLVIVIFLWVEELFVTGFNIIEFSNEYESLFKICASLVSAICGIYGAHRLSKKK